MNFRIVFGLIVAGLCALAVGGFIPHTDEFGKLAATRMLDAGYALVVSAVAILSPNVRTLFGGGERTGDRVGDPPADNRKPRAPPDGM